MSWAIVVRKSLSRKVESELKYWCNKQIHKHLSTIAYMSTSQSQNDLPKGLTFSHASVIFMFPQLEYHSYPAFPLCKICV